MELINEEDGLSLYKQSLIACSSAYRALILNLCIVTHLEVERPFKKVILDILHIWYLRYDSLQWQNYSDEVPMKLILHLESPQHEEMN